MKANVLDKTGKKIDEIALDKSVFGMKPNLTTLAQYVRVYLHNQRQGTSSTKNRGEVSGSGKKPWRQKGTGRARVGSKRIPLWRHGGIAHGPKPKSWNLTLPKKMKTLALRSALSQKAENNNILVIDDFKMSQPRTADLLNFLKTANLEKNRTLIILDENNLTIRKSAANIKKVNTALVHNVNAFEILSAQKVLFVKKALNDIEVKYATK